MNEMNENKSVFYNSLTHYQLIYVLSYWFIKMGFVLGILKISIFINKIYLYINMVEIKTSFNSQLEKDYYYENLLNILYGFNNRHRITFKDNNKYNLSKENVIISNE